MTVATTLPISPTEVEALASMCTLDKAEPQIYANPPAELQKRFNFHPLPSAYAEAAGFLNYMFSRIPPQPMRIPAMRVLDLGCGWGRMLRLLRRSPALECAELHGCDPDTLGLDFIRRTVPGVYVSHIQPAPPTIYRDGAFDLTYAYSVFSHLMPEAHLAWARELRRISNGYVCVTTQGEKFLGWAVGKEAYGALSESDALSRYRNGEPLFSPGNAEAPQYGHAAVPRTYFEKVWQPLGFHIVDWNEDGPQSRCLMQV